MVTVIDLASEELSVVGALTLPSLPMVARVHPDGKHVIVGGGPAFRLVREIIVALEEIGKPLGKVLVLRRCSVQNDIGISIKISSVANGYFEHYSPEVGGKEARCEVGEPTEERRANGLRPFNG